LARHGLQEIGYALDEELFTRQYLTSSDAKLLDPLRIRLSELRDRKVATVQQAHDLVLQFVKELYQLGGVADRPRAVVVFAMEFACGACNALDEYSQFLTPFHINALRGRYVGVGVDLSITDRKLVVSRIYPKSPAMDARQAGELEVGDRVREIDSVPVEGLPPDAVAERLLGEPDTIIELKVLRGDVETKLRLLRRAVATPSVEKSFAGTMGSGLEDIGYIRIHNFQDSTTQEVKDALIDLQSKGMKALVLDLRGNPGGLFKAAVQVSELFLGEGGVIVFTQGQLKEFNRPYKVESSNPFQAPMVVLVDGDTASAAEILAGALKENERAKLYGQPTFGKGSIQQVFPLDRSTGGLRVTVARFTSPLKHPVSAIGVVPNVLVVDSDADPTATLDRAVRELLLLLGRTPMPSMQQMPMSMPPAMSPEQ
jgi:carboxyl-terminal processing protease